MQVITKNKYSQEQHPWNWYIPDGATAILLGTFPTDVRNRKFDFFYSSPTNRLWEILTSLASHTIIHFQGKEAVEERKEILQKLKVGLTDMGSTILRQQGSSKDHSLFPLEFMDIAQVLTEHQAITKIIVSGNTQGNSSLSWLNTFCSINNIQINTKSLEKEKTSVIKIANRNIKIDIAYSPSRLSRITTDKLIANYKELIFVSV